MNTTTSPVTLKDVAHRVEQTLGQPIAPDVLQAIAKTCRDDFLVALDQCEQGKPNAPKVKEGLASFLACMTQENLEKLKPFVPDANLVVLAPVAKKQGRRLLEALSISSDASNPRRDGAEQFIRQLFPQTGPQATRERPRRESPASSRQPPEPPQGPSDEPSRRVSGNSTSPSRNDSMHIYGSNYALCFNDSVFNGRQGIMVDAAVSRGPRDYAWEDAIHIWLDPAEVAALLAVCRRFTDKAEFSNHGPQNNKSFLIEQQANGYFCRVACGGMSSHGARGARVVPKDMMSLTIFVSKVATKAYPDLSFEQLIETIRSSYDTGGARGQHSGRH